MKIYEIKYTGFNAENINDTLGSIELLTLLFKLACSKSQLKSAARTRRYSEAAPGRG